MSRNRKREAKEKKNTQSIVHTLHEGLHSQKVQERFLLYTTLSRYERFIFKIAIFPMRFNENPKTRSCHDCKMRFVRVRFGIIPCKQRIMYVTY